MPSLLGIDNGLTVTKAVIFDADGSQLSVARRRVPQLMPHARWVERDMAGLWQATADAVREAIAGCGRPAGDIKAVAATAHGDGLYLLDANRRPLGPGILSLDSRASAIVERWSQDRVFDEALALTGQAPQVSAPATLLAWLKENDPDCYGRIAHVLSCKDWLRFCLTGTIGTDRTEASTSFTDFRTQTYAPEAMRIFGLDDLFDLLPPVAHSADIVGHVTAEAAEMTGLDKGTPVACGLHDVTASALGMGGHEEGTLSIIAGTYSINEVVSLEPRVDRRWLCRNAIDPSRWNSMAISPASTANYDWFLDTFCRSEQDETDASGGSIHQLLADEIDAALKKPSTILFHPYLFGSPYGSVASGSFVGLHGWHNRGDMLKAVLEGIVFNHRTHVEALRGRFAVREIRLTGGGSRNPAFVQMFADALNAPVIVTSTDEAAAFGAALCAGTAVGLFSTPQQGARQVGRTARQYQPVPAASAVSNERFSLYCRIAEALRPQWPEIEKLAQQDIEGTA
ncbi:FGGY-family carbohydrate kinase [Mesorhizobium sp. M00.F.Ca.ET.216.01.1.1]|uniref:FGGY-family carbohydrate kinase n=1 Tax=Mesorhizobium sp. M00.F.Ca.ET.216.01.1.1 TaxID=2500528 RepID=UPI000FDB8DB0|nr:FGGY-family carbohydrate kinase [Mesorhizobium sp. M00.F.Ca.ET.216.01.1.1]TGQ37306.1 carbohydrate kinase [Mesorhizobium sp. M00.F.Ca.ET.216.01.1.1]TJW10980.1 MAG: carbohydrate kinase [Mesorhizobium sp.]TJW45486.1 MAG: carbohydrate kinase [Mesorhizobium sp.]